MQPILGESATCAVARTSLLVVGAGPYGVAVAARAVERGIATTVVGHPMGFWTDQMPEGMYLRSGFDWHLDASGVDTFEAFAEDRGISVHDVDPIPIAVFVEYASWFQARKQLVVCNHLVTHLTKSADLFTAELSNGSQITAERVVAAPGVGYFAQLPDWAPTVPDHSAHTSELVRFDDLAGARVLIVGGRQSAYEWAALLGDHGAQRVDIVHRHDVPAFERVSWAFVDPYIEATIETPGWWRSLPGDEQEAIGRQFWEAGRLTLEWWLAPRLAGGRFHFWPGSHVAEVTLRSDDTLEIILSNAERLIIDRVVFATGYRAKLGDVPYLQDLISEIEIIDGFPVLDNAFQTSTPNLYIPGFAATRDFGPFFGFTKACPAAANLIVDDLLRSG